jgi:hypothetical protein
MSTRALNAAPTPGAVALNQLRMVALLQRRDFLILGAIALGLIALAVYGYTNGEMSVNMDGGPEILPIFYPLTFPLLPLAALWPLGVWRRDDPSRRGYFWSMPTAQGPHTLMRVAAGWVTLMVVCAAVLLIGWGITMPATLRFEGVSIGYGGLWVPFVLTTLVYVVMSAFAVAFDHPILVVIGGWAAFLSVLLVTEISNADGVQQVLFELVNTFFVAVTLPALLGTDPSEGGEFASRWSRYYLIWMGVALLLLVAGAFYRRDSN